MPQSTSRSRRTSDVPAPTPLPADAAAVLLPLARAAIARELGLEPDVGEPPAWVHQPGACFVTLTLLGRLRGCIGSLTPRRSLLEDLTANARAAAFHDPRFAPLTRTELAATTIEVSVLSPITPMPCSGETDAVARLRPGVDGIVFECAGHRATFLPRVWDTLPDPWSFLEHLKLKAGFPTDFWSDSVRLSRYTVTELEEDRP